MKTLTSHQLTDTFDGWDIYMHRALELAQNVFSASPNPRVGCVIVKDDEIVGEGWHSGPGQNHAEIEALDRAGVRAQSAVTFVTLEPCAHIGKTGPCSQALIAAGVESVVIASIDPDRRVFGQGIVDLENANINVFHLTDFDDLAKDINPGYFKRHTSGMPFVRLKLAMSLDGRTGLANGESKWITSSEARRDVQKYRARSSAIVTGINTVLVDDPQLTVRTSELGIGEKELENNKTSLLNKPLRIVLDSNKRTPDTSQIICNDGKVKIFSFQGPIKSDKSPKNVEHIKAECCQGRVNLRNMLEFLSTSFACNDVLVEAGSTLSTSFINDNLVDELIVYIAPKILGRDARPLTEIIGLHRMKDCLQLKVKEVETIGPDIKIILTSKES